MPRVAKGAAKTGAPAKAAAAKKKNGYVKSEKIPLGEVLTDLSKQSWKIGSSIGSGGFGDIYCACKATGTAKKNEKDYDCVIKIEPHGNGPLFVEMHFYMRNAKLDDIKAFCTKHKVKSLGMPHIIGNGSHVLNGEKHRFLVIPRYGKDVWSFFLANGKRLPQHTIYRLAIQMLDVYEYIHDSTYVHADLKGANILLEYGVKNPSQAYLVDFGLACHYTNGDYKPDPRKMHNGTIEYTSRDAHNGVPTRRGDFEILGYNLIHWSGVELPWETQKLLTNPSKVQKAKEEFMKDVNESLNKLFNKNPPTPIKQFMDYVQSMEYNDTPDYDKCRKIFQTALKSLNKTHSGPLDMTLDKTSPAAAKTKIPAKRQSADSEDNGSESESEAESDVPSPARRTRSSMTPSKRPRDVDSKRTPTSPPGRKFKPGTPTSKKTAASRLRDKVTPKLNISAASSTTSTPTPQRPGKTVINDNVTPNPKSKKTYEFNFELDVSVDANVIVNVKRKKKAPAAATTTAKASSGKDQAGKENIKSDRNEADSDSEVPPSPVDSPVPKVSVRRMRTAASSPAGASPRVTCRRVK